MPERVVRLMGMLASALLPSLAHAQEQLASNGSIQPSLPAAEMGWGAYFQAIAVVFVMLGLLLAGFYFLRRMMGGSRFLGRGMLRLEAQLPLGPRRHVAVVRFLNKRLVLGVTDNQINLLTQEDADDETTSSSFDHALRDERDDSDEPDTP